MKGCDMRSLCALLLLCGISAVGQPPNPESIKQHVAELSSADIEVKRSAIDHLYEKVDKQRSYLLVSEQTRLQLESYLGQWRGSSGSNAALLIGLLGDGRAIQALRKTRAAAAEMERKNDPMENRNCFAPDLQFACLKALLRLQDAGAVREVRSLLHSIEVENRAKGIDCVSYAECKALVPDLLLMLNDKRDAVNIAPTHMKAFLRTCDLAVNAIVDICKTKTKFSTEHGNGHGARYTDEQIAEIRKATELWLKKK